MCLVSSAVSEWVFPIIYHSLCFATARDITDFVTRHDKPNKRTHNRLPLVRDLYIGRNPHDQGDLFYGSSHWPITALGCLLSFCTELRSLTILYLDQHLWQCFQPLLPSHLEKITLGPMHGTLNSKALKQRPPVSFLTSANTYLSDGEIEDVVTYPTMTRVRKLCEANSMAPLWAVNQSLLLNKTEHIKKYEIVICGPLEYAEPAYVLAKRRKEELGLDDRVVLSQYLGETWVTLVYQEFVNDRRSFIGRL